jgi:hypothetical protein
VGQPVRGEDLRTNSSERATVCVRRKHKEAALCLKQRAGPKKGPKKKKSIKARREK